MVKDLVGKQFPVEYLKALFWDRSFFSVVIDSLLATCSNSEFIKYADDVTVLMYIRNISDDCVNTELENILERSEKAKFAINWSKTIILNIVTSRQLVFPTIRLISGDEIKEVDHARILGVHFTNDLKWKCHVATILKRARQSLILILQLARNACPQDWCWNVYNALMRSLLSYGVPAWCNVSKHLFKQLERVEHRVEKIIGTTARCSLASHCDKICKRLARKVILSEHQPLREAILCRNPDPSGRILRHRSSTGSVFAASTRLKNSFTKYGSI
jgi:hypothetical protein